MKIPTKHINTKHTFMFTGALAAVVTLTPAVSFAHGGGDGRDGRSHANSQDRRSSNSGAKTASNTSNKNSNDGKHHNHGGNYDGQKWWGQLSAENFQKMHDAKLAKLDDIIAKNNLTVENGDALRADLVTKADGLTTNLTALQELRQSIDKNAMTDEQKQALKAQTLTTFEAFYDYYESLYSYKAAIKVAADASHASVDVKVEKED